MTIQMDKVIWRDKRKSKKYRYIEQGEVLVKGLELLLSGLSFVVVGGASVCMSVIDVNCNRLWLRVKLRLVVFGAALDGEDDDADPQKDGQQAAASRTSLCILVTFVDFCDIEHSAYREFDEEDDADGEAKQHVIIDDIPQPFACGFVQGNKNCDGGDNQQQDPWLPFVVKSLVVDAAIEDFHRFER